MPLPTQAKTAALVAATALTAAGLNLGVLGIGDDGDATSVELTASTSDSTSETQPSTSAVEQTETVSSSEPNRSSGEVPSTAAPPAASTASSSGQSVTTTTPDASTSTATSSTTPTTVASREDDDHHDYDDDYDDDHDDDDYDDDYDDDSPSNTTVTAAPSATEYLTYKFDGVATIVVALHDGNRLEFWSATPEPGWSFSAEQDSSTEIEVDFRSSDGEDEAEWDLKLRDGDLRVKQEFD